MPDDPTDLARWQLEQIEAGLADLDAGRVVPHEEVVAWVNSWETPHPIDPPSLD